MPKNKARWLAWQLPSTPLQLIEEHENDEGELESDRESVDERQAHDGRFDDSSQEHAIHETTVVPLISGCTAILNADEVLNQHPVNHVHNLLNSFSAEKSKQVSRGKPKTSTNSHDAVREASYRLLDKWTRIGDDRHGIRAYTEAPVRNLKKYRLARKLKVPQSDAEALDIMRDDVIIRERAAAAPKQKKFNSPNSSQPADNEQDLDGEEPNEVGGADNDAFDRGDIQDAVSESDYSFSVAGGSVYAGGGGIISPERSAGSRMLYRSNMRRSTSGSVYGDAVSRLDDMSEISSVFDPPQIIKHSLTQDLMEAGGVMLNRSLPIFHNRESICTAVQQFPVSLISGPTGIGKTLQVPLFLFADHLLRTPDAPIRIIVTQPRRIAAISAARRVCYEQSVGKKDGSPNKTGNPWVLGGLVGFHIGHMRNWSPETIIVYCTTAVLLQRLLARGNLDDFSIIILDEAHERDADMDMLLMLVRTLLCQRPGCTTKLLIMSATMDVDHIRKYMQPVATAHNVITGSHGANSLKLEVSMHETLVKYLDQFGLDCCNIEFDKTAPKLYSEIMRTAAELVLKIDEQENTKMKSNKSTVLVFLPGIEALREFADLLQNVLDEKVSNRGAASGGKLGLLSGSKRMKYSEFECVLLHSTSPMEEQERIWQRPPTGKRRIIISTNVAESSITVPDVEHVIDFCLTKRLAMDRTGSIARLSLCWASKSNATQRKGRTGRVQKGQCFRMVPMSFFNTLNEHAVSEFCEAPLSTSILKLKSLNSPTHPSVFASLLIEPPMQHDIYHGITMLKELSALSMSDDGVSANICCEDGMPTDVGRLMQRLPIDPRLSRLIVLGYCFGLLDEAIIIAAALTVQYVIAQPNQQEWNAYCANLEFARGSFSDPISLMNIYNEYVALTSKAGDAWQVKKQSALRWGFVNERRLAEMKILVEEIRARLGVDKDRSQMCMKKMATQMDEFGLTADDRMLLLKVLLAGAFFPFYAISDEQRDERECFALTRGTNARSTVLVTVEYDEGLSRNIIKQPIAPMMQRQHQRSYAQPGPAIRSSVPSSKVVADPPSRVHARAYTESLISLLHDQDAVGTYAAQIFADTDAVLTHARRAEEPSYFQFHAPTGVGCTNSEMSIAPQVLVALRIQRSRGNTSNMNVDSFTRHKDFEQSKIDRRTRRFNEKIGQPKVEAAQQVNYRETNKNDDDNEETFASLLRGKSYGQAKQNTAFDDDSSDSDEDENQIQFYHRYQREQLERNNWHTYSTQIGIFKSANESDDDDENSMYSESFEIRVLDASSVRRSALITLKRYVLPPVVESKLERVRAIASAVDSGCSNRFWCQLASSSADLYEVEKACSAVLKQQHRLAILLKISNEKQTVSTGKLQQQSLLVPHAVFAVGECRIVPTRLPENVNRFRSSVEDADVISSDDHLVPARAIVVAVDRNTVSNIGGVDNHSVCAITLHFIDYGHYEIFSIEDLLHGSPRALPSNAAELMHGGATASTYRETNKLLLSVYLNCLLNTPPLAFPCQLKNVFVSQTQRKQVQALYEEYNVIGQECELAVYAHHAETAIVILFIPVKTSNTLADGGLASFSLSWSDLLISRKLAVELPEKHSKEAERSRIRICMQTKARHCDTDETWGDEATDDQQADGEPPKSVGELQSAAALIITQREHTRYMKPYARNPRRRLNICLYSPLEITRWQSVWSGVDSSRIEMSRNSNTAICIDAEPDLPFDRVVVAADSRRIGHSTVQLGGTTLMPRQPGMLGLLCMLFSPCVLLRYDAREQRLSGCRGGSGGDADGYPLYAEHDVEVLFDCLFSGKDMENVNVARTCINRMVRRAFTMGQLHLHVNLQYERKELVEAVLGLVRESRKMAYDYETWRNVKRRHAESIARAAGHFPWKDFATEQPYRHDPVAVRENYMYQAIDLSCFEDLLSRPQNSAAAARSSFNSGKGRGKCISEAERQNNFPRGCQDVRYSNDEEGGGGGGWGERRAQLIDMLAYSKAAPMVLN